MEDCSWNWEIASKYIPLIIALGVYFLWYRQKGKEVVAGEAKQYMSYLNRLQSMQPRISSAITDELDVNRIRNSLMTVPEVDRLINEYNSIVVQMSDSGNFIYFALNEDQYFKELNSKYLVQARNYTKNSNKVLKSNLISYTSVNIPDSKIALKINKYLVQHALYKQEFKRINKLLGKTKVNND